MLRRNLKTLTTLSNKLIDIETKYSAHNYHPIPVVFAKAKGCYVWDPEGNKYIDFLGGYAVVNQGHLHPKIVNAAKKQLDDLTISCRAFHNNKFPLFAKFMNKTFGYDMVLPMNTGAEAVETGIKLARRYGYEKKGIPENKAIVIAMENNFHGRTTLSISLSSDPSSYGNYGPLVPNIIKVKYGDIQSLDEALKKHSPNVCAVIAEPVQGEAGVVIPPQGYLANLRKLCDDHKVLWIDDEVQAGLGRTGTLLSVYRENVRPDIVLLAKALGGGILPVSCVLADKHIMEVFTPGTHGSTFGGNPMASSVAMASLKVLLDEKLSENAKKLEEPFLMKMREMQNKYPFITDTRCIGLWGAIEFDPKFRDGSFATKLSYMCKDGYKFSIAGKKMGLLCKPTHGNILRLSPPLIIKEKELMDGLDIINCSIMELN
jgi:ornithine--oxo-acid transaminase